ncbi:DUF1302 domain-containing protein [Motiliproteus coralliicola]|uniref:DUF1302 domain-containing protein n=1 Tax=Motiliproteus coralliicola TaxID=2283196 RepID=A0A369WWS6_9GAMM|nr:DUF1302 domain-containing protein [Motiliproteus coralliicola]RDE24996.1 DUF1302 domain-containing protein [Motiliproteus coralliicola]
MTTKVLNQPVLNTKRGFKLTPLCSAMILAGTLSAPYAHAVYEFNIGEIEGQLDSELSLGVTVRTEGQSARLVDPQNGALRGVTGTAKSKTIDDGNLNFNKGDVVSNVFKGTHGLSLRKDNIGAFVRVKYWYDFELENQDVRHGSTTTGYAPAGGRIGLNDSKFDNEAKFSGIDLQDAFIYGEFEAGEMPVDLRLGRQVVSWGESTFIGGGINQINPIDVPAFRRPGALLKDVLMPVNLAYGSIGLTDNLTAEAFYQLEWEPFTLDGCGTFFATSDIAAPGCSGVNTRFDDLAVFGSDGSFIPWNGGVSILGAPVAIARGEDKEAKNSGQFGLAGRYYVEDIETEFGAYFMNYHSRRPYFAVTSEADNPTYQLAYPENLKVYGLSFNTTVGGVSWSGEISYQPDFPVGWNTAEALQAAILSENGFGSAGQVNPGFYDELSSIRDTGNTLVLADEYDVYQVQTTFIQFWDQVMGASRLSLIGEIGATYSQGIDEDFDDIDTRRYGRGIVYGNCTTEGVTDPSVACDEGGFVTKFAWGYRLKAALSYNDVFAGVNMTPSITWRDDVDGVAPNGNFIEGRQSVSLALDADYLGQYNASIAYTNYITSDWDPLADRDHLTLSIGMSF